MNMNVSSEVVRQLRLKRGWTQEQLAHLANVNVRTIQRVEKTGICDLETRSALAAVFEVEASQLDGEKKIEQALSGNAKRPLVYQRLSSGQGVVDIFSGAHAYRLTNEEPRSKDDAEYVAWFLNHLHDYSEAWDEIDPGARVEATYELGQIIKEMEQRGLCLFGLRTKAKANPPPVAASGADPVYLRIGNLHVAYADSNKILVLDPNARM